MKQRLKSYLLILGLVSMVGSAALTAPVEAVNVFEDACTGNANTEVCKAKSESINPVIRTVINTMLFIIGTLSVIMIIVGGIKYVTSDGDSNRITSAKNTILYSVVGLIVALLAFTIVSFVIDQFK